MKMSYGIPRVHYYYFYNEPALKKDTCMRTTSVTVFFFRKWHSESYLITAMFKVPSQQVGGTLKTAFWKIVQLNNLRTWSTNALNQTIHPDFGKYHETKIEENAWKKINCTRILACTSKNITPK